MTFEITWSILNMMGDEEIVEEANLPKPRSLETEITIEGSEESVLIFPEGYGGKVSEEVCGATVLLEHYNGTLRLLVWADINKDYPTHIVSLEGARRKAHRPREVPKIPRLGRLERAALLVEEARLLECRVGEAYSRLLKRPIVGENMDRALQLERLQAATAERLRRRWLKMEGMANGPEGTGGN